MKPLLANIICHQRIIIVVIELSPWHTWKNLVQVFVGHSWITILTRDTLFSRSSLSSHINKIYILPDFVVSCKFWTDWPFAFSHNTIIPFQKCLKKWLTVVKLIMQLYIFWYYPSTKFAFHLIFLANCYWFAALNISWMRYLLILVMWNILKILSKITKLKPEWNITLNGIVCLWLS